MIQQTSSSQNVIRCKWCEQDPLLTSYHDYEWGVYKKDNTLLFEYLTLEIFQAGLSWKTILHKRENFREAFDHFDINKIAAYSEAKIEELMQNAGIVRNRRKIEATIKNAAICMNLIEQYGSFSSFLETLPEENIEKQKELKKVFKHVGLTTAESFFMATGIMNPAHDPECFLAK
jgi:DNA-3-methyladenine glycosylase I